MIMIAMRCLRPNGRRGCQLLGGDTAAFCASLVEGLAHLESTLDVDGGGGGGGAGAVSMRWCADAMRLVKRMQRELLAIFRKADVTVAVVSSCGGGAGKGAGAGDWFEHYMQETAALLDFCNAFKAAVSRLHRYCMVVDFAAQVGGRAAGGDAAAVSLVGGWAPEPEPGQSPSPSTVRDKLADVKAAVTEAERLGRTIISSAGGRGSDAGMVVVTLVAKITTSVVSMFVLQALTSPSPLDAGDGRPTALGCAVVPELEPWRESLSLIHARFPSRATVAEHEQVAMVVQDLINAQMESHGDQQEVVRRHVELLRARSGELREGVEMFACVLDECLMRSSGAGMRCWGSSGIRL
ncbi:hypothetical protein ACP70R_003849 [Stipagrostis hirtigluma subsp. patula]